MPMGHALEKAFGVKDRSDEKGIITPHATDSHLKRRRTVSTLVTNLSPELELFLRSITPYDVDNVLEMERERREGIVSTLVTVLHGPKGRRISRTFMERGAATILELETLHQTTKMTVRRNLRRLMSCDIVKIIEHIGPPYKPRGTPGPPTPIYGLVGVGFEAVVDAQRRYGEIVKMQQRPEQAHIDEAIAFIRCVLNQRRDTKAALKDLLPKLTDQGIDLETAKAAAHRLSSEGEYRIWQ